MDTKDKKPKTNIKDKKTLLVISAILIIVIFIISLVIVLTRGNDKKIENNNSAIDAENGTYQGKTIYEENGNIIIQEENDSKTIETKEEVSEYTLTDDNIKKQYSFSNVNLTKSGATTIVRGNVKNNSSKYSKAYVNVKFLTDGNVVGSASVLVEKIKKGKSKDFQIDILGDYSNSTYELIVEYVK